MDNEAKRTGGKPIFDTDLAWARFERSAAGEPVPAFWRQAADERQAEETSMKAKQKGDSKDDEKDGGMKMMKTGTARLEQAAPQAAVSAAARKAGEARLSVANGAWRTEKPARRRLRRWSAGVAAAAMAACLLATPLGDRTLAAMLQTFRVQHMVGVGVTADDMAKISGLLERGSPEGDQSFNLAQYGTLTQTGGGKARVVTWEEAESRMGAPLLRLGNPDAPSLQPATTLTFRLNVKAVNRLLTRLGSHTVLPAEADGKAITLHIPDGVAVEGDLAGKRARLLQFGKPELTIEGGIDAAAVREAILGLPVLPDSLRTKLAAIGDWQSTLPVPVRDGATENLRLDGRDAVMAAGDAERFLLWLDGDRMNLLSAGTADFPDASAFRLAAEALIGR